MALQVVRERDGPIYDVFVTSHWHIDKNNQFETSQRRTNWYLSETSGEKRSNMGKFSAEAWKKTP